jgi:hypothetical protein
MPIPKVNNADKISVNGSAAKKLITVVKPYKDDMPDILEKINELAKVAKENKN